MTKLGCWGWSKGQLVSQIWAGEDLDIVVLQHVADLVEEWGVQNVLVDKKSLHGIASSRVVRLGILDDLDGLGGVGGLVNVHMADAFSVTKYGNHLALFLDGTNEVAGSAWDDQINVLVQLKQVADGFTSRNLEFKFLLMRTCIVLESNELRK